MYQCHKSLSVCASQQLHIFNQAFSKVIFHAIGLSHQLSSVSIIASVFTSGSFISKFISPKFIVFIGSKSTTMEPRGWRCLYPILRDRSLLFLRIGPSSLSRQGEGMPTAPGQDLGVTHPDPCPGSCCLNFSDRTRTGVFNMIWP